MRFLFVNQYYAPDFAATAQQMSDLCEKLAAEGHEVHVLSGRALYDGRDIDLPAYETINGVHVHRVKICNQSRARFRDRFLGYICFSFLAFFKATFLPRFDVVVTLTTPPMIALLGTWLRLVRKSRFVYWVMDIYPDIALEAGVLKKFGPITGIWNILGRISYLTANRVVVLGEDMKKVMRRKGIPERKLQVIQSWACGEEIRPIPSNDNRFRRESLRPHKFTLMYSGNMGTCHAFESVIEGIKVLEDDPRFDFVFIGAGKKLEELQHRLSGMDGRVRFMPYQERSLLAETLSAPDAHLATLDPRYDGLLVPSKLYGIMAAGKPVVFVGSPENEIARIIAESRCGLRVDPENPQSFADALRRLADSPDEAREFGGNGRRAFDERYERDSLCAKFMTLLEDEAHRPGVRGERTLAHPVVTSRPARQGEQVLE